MRRAFLLLTLGTALFAADAPRVSRSTVAAVEKNLDDKISRLWDDNVLILMGPTRGVYLDNYGAVFSTEINLVLGPPFTLVRPVPPKEEIVKHRLKKLERLPDLKKAMRQALMDVAATMDTVPADEQIVIVAFLSRYPWEDTNGLPVQVMWRAQKKKLLELMRGPSTPELEAAIQVTQN
jgi:hypothetical protein